MKAHIFTAALLALAVSPSIASANADSGETVAIEACSAFNEYGPTELVEVVEDGMGDYLVWLNDIDGDLWACNASEDGDIYANVMVVNDLLEGEGADMVHLVSGTASRYPEKQAERLCLALADEDASLVATVEDGLGDYLVWLDTGDGETFVMCNASSDGKLYTFEEVAMPLNDEVVVAPATATTEETPDAPVTRPPSRPSQFG